MMCFAAPARVIRLSPGRAEVERRGEIFEVSTLFLEETPAVGDWLAVQARRNALSVMTEAEAQELLGLYDRITRQLEGSTS